MAYMMGILTCGLEGQLIGAGRKRALAGGHPRPQIYDLPGKLVAYNYGPLSMNCGLLYGAVAYHFGFRGFPDRALMGTMEALSGVVGVFLGFLWSPFAGASRKPGSRSGLASLSLLPVFQVLELGVY